LVQIGDADGKTISICPYHLSTDYRDGRSLQVYEKAHYASLFAPMSGQLLCVQCPPRFDWLRLKQAIGRTKGSHLQTAKSDSRAFMGLGCDWI
jgi:hypothetical protein